MFFFIENNYLTTIDESEYEMHFFSYLFMTELGATYDLIKITKFFKCLSIFIILPIYYKFIKKLLTVEYILIFLL
jgi:hypothetical protein